jgi:hypothetical protein
VFVTPEIFGQELEELGVVQRFASLTTDHVREVRLDDGLTCTCPGWRKYAECWHIAFVLKHNVGSNWRLGTFLKTLPSALDWQLMEGEQSKEAWLEENIAVVSVEDLGVEKGPRSRAEGARELLATTWDEAEPSEGTARTFLPAPRGRGQSWIGAVSVFDDLLGQPSSGSLALPVRRSTQEGERTCRDGAPDQT